MDGIELTAAVSAPPIRDHRAGGSIESALVLDVHPIFSLGCAAVLRELGIATVRHARNSEEAVALAERHAPGLVILGAEEGAIAAIAAAAPGARLVVIGDRPDAGRAAGALRAGAHGFLARDADCEELRAAISRVLGGAVYLDHDMATEIALLHSGRRGGALDGLSPRERLLLRLVSEGEDLRAVAQALSVSYKTAANLTWGLKKKLGARNVAELVRISMLAA